MTDRYALFLYDVYDSEGGVNDLEHIGTMQECIERAEKSGRNEESHIARMEDLAIVKTGRWVFTQHPLVGHPGTYEYLWRGRIHRAPGDSMNEEFARYLETLDDQPCNWQVEISEREMARQYFAAFEEWRAKQIALPAT